MATVRSAPSLFNASLKSTSCPCAVTRRASRAITQLYDMVLAPTGMKSTQFVILRILADQGVVPQWRLAAENAVAVETLSRRLAALRNKGLVSLEISGSRGEHLYSLTPVGREALEAARPYWERANSRLEQVVGPEELKSLVSCVDRLAAAAHEALALKTRNQMRR